MTFLSFRIQQVVAAYRHLVSPSCNIPLLVNFIFPEAVFALADNCRVLVTTCKLDIGVVGMHNIIRLLVV